MQTSHRISTGILARAARFPAVFALLTAWLLPSPAPADEWHWLLPHAVAEHTLFLLGLVLLVAIAVYLAIRLYRLRRDNLGLQTHAEERLRIITSLRDTDSRFRDSADISPVGVMFTDPECACLYANRRLTAIAGRSAEEMMGTGWWRTIHPADVDEVRREWRRNQGGHAPILFEVRFQTPADDVAWVLGQAVAQYGAQGDIIGYVLTVTDITERKSSEQELAEREARFRASERIANIGNWERSFATNRILWSDQVFRIYGEDPATFVPSLEAIHERIHPDDLFDVRYAIEDVVERRGRLEIEHRVVRPDGDIRWVHVHGVMETDDACNPLFFRGTIQDITDLRQTQEALRQSEDRFRVAFDAGGAGFAIADRNLRFVRVNGALCRFLGYTREELLQLGRDDITHPDELQQSYKVADDLLHGRESMFSREKRYIRKDGKIVWAMTTTVTFTDPLDGEKYLFANIQDITDNRQTQEALHQSEERFRSAFDACGTGMMISDRTGRYVRANAAFCRFVGYGQDEILKLSFREITHPDDAHVVSEVYRKLFSGETAIHTRERRYIRKDGSVVWGIVTAVLVDDPFDGEKYLITNVQDISERKEVEEALARNEARLLSAQRIAGVGDWERDVEAGITYLSGETRRLFGLGSDLSEVHFRDFVELVHPKDRDAVVEGNRLLVERGVSYGCDYRIVRPDDGEVRYVRSEAEVSRNAQGEPVRIIGTIQDITALKKAEVALQASEVRFRGVFEAGATGIIVTTASQYLTETNRALQDFVGYSAQELRALRPLELLVPEDRPAALTDRRTLLEGREDRVFNERRFVHRNGEVRWANVGISRLDLPDSDEPMLVVTVQDISDRKQADEALARKTRLLDLIREIALAANQATDYDQVVHLCLDRVCAFMDWPVGHAYLLKDDEEEELEYLPIWYLNDPEKYAPLVETCETVQVRTGFHLPGEVLQQKTAIWRENIPRRGAGSGPRGQAIRQVGLKSGFGVPVMAGNDIVAVMEFLSDRSVPLDAELVGAMSQIGTEIGRVFERKRAAERLLRSEQRLRQIIDNAPLFIYVKDFEGRYLLANRAMEKIYGIPNDSMIGKRQQDIYPYPDITRRSYESDREVIESGQARVFPDWQIHLHSGEDRTVRLIKLPFTANDGARCVLGIAVDITDEKRAEEERWRAQRLDALGQMTGGVAHDFNNLLTIILGNLQLLGRRLEDPSLLKLTGAAERAARRGGDVTGRLLAFARSQPLEPQPVDLNGLLGDILPLLERTVGPGIEIDCRQNGTLANVLVDSAQLESALINLTANARDAMPDGGRIVIRTRNAEVRRIPRRREPVVRPGEYVTVSVSDTGIGMDSDVAARALEPFFTTKAVGKGSGLGLSSVYGFAEQSGGGVAIDSTPGKGTRVTIYLPRSPDVATRPSEPARAGSTGREETILVVEDDPDVRAFAAAALANLNYRVVEAADGADAIAALDGSQEIDLVFSDVMLPGELDGRALAREALKRCPGLKVVLTSGNWDLAAPGSQPNPEGVATLAKPYTAEDLGSIIVRVLGRTVPEKSAAPAPGGLPRTGLQEEVSS